MAKTRRRARFAQETKLSRFVTEVSFADDFQCHRGAQIDIHRLVSDAHCTATQLDRFPLFVKNQFVMLESVGYARCYLSFALVPDAVSSDWVSLFDGTAKHAHGTEFRCPGKLITATGADASVPGYGPWSRFTKK